MLYINRYFKLSIVFILLTCFATPAFSLMDPHIQSPVPDTGQTGDYTATFGEDSDYTFNPMSFTKLDASGNALPENATDWAMVRDNVTGLVWEAKKSNDGAPNYDNPHDADNTYTWYDPNPDTNGGVAGTPGDKTDTLDFINAINSEKLGGFADWRMPTKQELNSIVNFGGQNPAIIVVPNFFENTISSHYWTANTVAALPDNAWKVDFYGGGDFNHSKLDQSGKYHLRAVRGGQSRLSGSLIINGNLVNNGDNTVTDTNTGLMWQKTSSSDIMNWENAIVYAEKLNLAGYDDWRLPTPKELASISAINRHTPAIDTTFFDSRDYKYLSGTTYSPDSMYRWAVDFVIDGHAGIINYTDDTGSVRCVRSGLSSLSPKNIAIVTPAQGSIWAVGETMPIKWDTKSLGGDVSILVTNSTGSPLIFPEVVPNTGSFNLLIPSGIRSVNCQMIITPIIDQSKATTQGLFSIVSSKIEFISNSITTVESDTPSATITVRRVGDSTVSASVDYKIYGGTAIAGSDFITPVARTLTWAAGESGDKTFNIPLINDVIDESNETIHIYLTNPKGGAEIGNQGSSVLSITDDDNALPAGSLHFGLPTYQVNEADGSVTVTISRTGGNSGSVSVDYGVNITETSATEGNDFTLSSGKLTWADGDNADKSFVVNILDDTVVENIEKITVDLNNSTGGASITSWSKTTIQIIDNDAQGGSSISGTIYKSDGITPLTGEYIDIDVVKGEPCGVYTPVQSVTDSFTTGEYRISGLVEGTYYIKTHTYNASNYISEWWASGSSKVGCDLAEPITVGITEEITGKDFQLDTKAPTATTTSATSIKATSATLNGTVNPNGLVTVYYFEYGPTSSYGQSTASINAGNGTIDKAISADLTNLSINTTYHFRLVATNTTGTIAGSDQTFTTPGIAPTATTTSATLIKATSATLNGTVNPNGSATTYYFEYGPTSSYGLKTGVADAGDGTADKAVSVDLTALSINTTYHFRLVATNTTGTIEGSDQTFTTPGIAPTATTSSATLIKATSATLNGTVNPNGLVTVYYFEYGPTSSYGQITTSINAGNGIIDKAVSVDLTTLSINTTYHFRLVATNTTGTIEGGDQIFTTPGIAPTATTSPASAVAPKSATLNGTVNPNGSATTYYFEYGPTSNYDQSTTSINAGNGIIDKAVSVDLTTLSINTTYHFRLVATNTTGTIEGGDQTFTTPGIAPTATTSTASAVAPKSATLNGTVNPNGSATTYYFEYGTTTSYGSKTGVADAGDGTSDKAVSVDLTALSINTTYHFRLVATNTTGTIAGSDQTFTTPGIAPTATTSTASAVAPKSATLNGTVNPNGSATTYYFEYGTTTSYGSKTGVADAGDGTSDKAVSVDLTALSINTTYHFRLVATNTTGTIAGSDQTFTTPGIAPTATTSTASAVAPKSATLNGTVNPNGLVTVYYFEYGTTSSYGQSTTAINAGNGTIDKAVSVDLTALSINTTYHFRLVATNTTGTIEGGDQTFTTPGIAPTATTSTASAVAPKSATLNGTVNPNGSATTYYFEYGQTTSYGLKTGVADAGDGTSDKAVSVDLTALNINTTYHFRLVATNTTGTIEGGDQTFTTPGIAPTATTSTVSAVAPKSATLNGTVNPNGSATTYYFEYGQTASYGSKTGVADAGDGTSDKAVSVDLTALSINTTYHFRLVATNTTGTIEGGDQTFTTPGIAPTATTSPVSGVAPKSATLNGTVNPNSSATTYYFEYGTTASYGSKTGVADAGDGTSDKAVSVDLTALSINTTYHFRLVATNTTGTVNGSDQTFTTPGIAPTATTSTSSAVAPKSATLNGTVNPNGSATTYYFEYGTTTSYGSKTGVADAGDGTSDKAVSVDLTALSINTTYHFRLVATNSTGTIAGSDQTFTTPGIAPTATTITVSTVAPKSATLNGTVNPNGSATTYYFEYGTTLSYGSKTGVADAGDGTSDKAVSVDLTALNINTTYHFRLVATNTTGTIEGGDQTFTTPGIAPTATTSPVSGVAPKSAILNGTVNPNGSATTYYFEYGPTASYGQTTGVADAGDGTSDKAVSVDLTSLSINTTYHFRLVATNTTGTIAGSDQIFTTPGIAPTATTSTVSAIAPKSATLNGTVNPNGSATTYYFEYGTTASYGQSTGVADAGDGTSDKAVSVDLTSLSINTTYHFRLVATNTTGTIAGSDQIFTTPGIAPTATTSTVSAIAPKSATLNGTVNPNGSATTYYFEYGTTTSYGQKTGVADAGDGTSDKAVSVDLTALSINTTYHFRLVATNTTGTIEGGDQTFTTSGGNAGVIQFQEPSYDADEADAKVIVMVTRTGGSDGSVSVDYAPKETIATNPSTEETPTTFSVATETSDFTLPQIHTLTWADGENTAKIIEVSIINDNLEEVNETLILQLLNPKNGASIGEPFITTITIEDNDSPVIPDDPDDDGDIINPPDDGDVVIPPDDGDVVIPPDNGDVVNPPDNGDIVNPPLPDNKPDEITDITDITDIGDDIAKVENEDGAAAVTDNLTNEIDFIQETMSDDTNASSSAELVSVINITIENIGNIIDQSNTLFEEGNISQDQALKPVQLLDDIIDLGAELAKADGAINIDKVAGSIEFVETTVAQAISEGATAEQMSNTSGNINNILDNMPDIMNAVVKTDDVLNILDPIKSLTGAGVIAAVAGGNDPAKTVDSLGMTVTKGLQEAIDAGTVINTGKIIGSGGEIVIYVVDKLEEELKSKPDDQTLINNTQNTLKQLQVEMGEMVDQTASNIKDKPVTVIPNSSASPNSSVSPNSSADGASNKSASSSGSAVQPLKTGGLAIQTVGSAALKDFTDVMDNVSNMTTSIIKMKSVITSKLSGSMQRLGRETMKDILPHFFSGVSKSGVSQNGLAASENNIEQLLTDYHQLLNEVIKVASVNLTEGILITSDDIKTILEKNPSLTKKEKATLINGLPGLPVFDQDIIQSQSGLNLSLVELLRKEIEELETQGQLPTGTTVEAMSSKGIELMIMLKNSSIGLEMPLYIQDARIVSSVIPQGLHKLPEGNFILVRNGIAGTITPAPLDSVNTLLSGDALLKIDSLFGSGSNKKEISDVKVSNSGNLNLKFQDGTKFSGSFGYGTTKEGDGGFDAGTSSFELHGTDPATEAYSILEVYSDGTTQQLVPSISAIEQLVQVLDKLAAGSYTFDKTTGIFTVMGMRFKSSYLIEPITFSEQDWFNTNKDKIGIAWETSDYNGDGAVDLKMWTDDGKQVIYTVVQ